MDSLADLVPPLSSSEARFIRNVVDRLRRLESRARGSYAEALICNLLPGAELATYAVSPHDLIWGGITIAVRTTGSRNADHTPDTPPHAGSWNFPPVESWDPENPDVSEKRRCWAQVAVLAFHDGSDLAAGWRFYVLSANQARDLPHQGHHREGPGRTRRRRCRAWSAASSCPFGDAAGGRWVTVWSRVSISHRSVATNVEIHRQLAS